jgi:hypothetical protein
LRDLPPGVAVPDESVPRRPSLLANAIQNTTIAAIIGVAEVLETANRQVDRLTYTTFESHASEIFAGVMAVFFVISFPYAAGSVPRASAGVVIGITTPLSCRSDPRSQSTRRHPSAILGSGQRAVTRRP